MKSKWEPTPLNAPELTLPEDHYRLIVSLNPTKDKYLHFVTNPKVSIAYDMDLWITELDGTFVKVVTLLEYMRESNEQLAFITRLIDEHALVFLYPGVVKQYVPAA